MTQTYMTSMELLTLFHKTDFEVINTTVYAHKLLSTLLTFVNKDVSTGYKAWPATELLIKRSGMKSTSLTKYRKELIAVGLLLHIVQNAGPGRSCIYYINAPLIAKLATQCGATHSDKPIAVTVLPDSKVEIHKRNTTGLLNQPCNKPVAPVIVPDVDDMPDPFCNAVAVPQSGFKQQYYGTWYYSQGELDKAKIARDAEQRRLRELEDDENCPF